MTSWSRLAIGGGAAVTLALLVADAHVAGIAVWKIVLAACGLALVRIAR